MRRKETKKFSHVIVGHSGWWILSGRLLQSRGPAAAKLRSPNRVLVRGTQRVSMSTDRSRRRPAWETS